MPDNSKRDALARQWQLLKTLPSRSAAITASQIANQLAAEGFQVTKRTVERDLVLLSTLFPLDCEEDQKPYRWRWLEGRDAALPGVTIAEALSLTLVEEYLRPLLPRSIWRVLQPRFEAARQKLDATSASNRVGSWVHKVRSVIPTLPLIPPVIDEQVLEALEAALIADRQIKVSYKAGGSEEPKDLILNPLSLIQRGPVTYLVATAFRYSDIRLYAVHRISMAEMNGEPSIRPETYSVDAYIESGAMEFGDGGTIKLAAKVSENLAKALRETAVSADMSLVERPDGWVLTATLADSWQLRWWILSQASDIEVLQPTGLRREIRNVLHETLNQYSLEGQDNSHHE